MRDVATFTSTEDDHGVELEAIYAADPAYAPLDPPWADQRIYVRRSYLADWKNRIVEEMAIERIRLIVRDREERDRGEPVFEAEASPSK